MRSGRRRRYEGITWRSRVVAASVLVTLSATAGTAAATSTRPRHDRAMRLTSITPLGAVFSSAGAVDRAVMRAIHSILEKAILAAHGGSSTAGPGRASAREIHHAWDAW